MFLPSVGVCVCVQDFGVFKIVCVGCLQLCVLCVLCVVCRLCVQDFWWVSSRLPLRRTAQNVALFFFHSPAEISLFLPLGVLCRPTRPPPFPPTTQQHTTPPQKKIGQMRSGQIWSKKLAKCVKEGLIGRVVRKTRRHHQQACHVDTNELLKFEDER